MTTTVRFAGLTTVCLLWAAAAGAQTSTSSTTSPPPQTSTQSTSSEKETRPATTTFFGDTGLWFLPTGEVLPHGKVSVSGYRRGTNWIQGYTNVGDFAGTVGVGLGGRAELFGSFLVDTRIDRDVRPLFLVDNSTFGGIVDRYPRVTQQWTGDNVGDLYVGAKVNLWSEYRQNPAAFAIRALVKAPTGKKDAGVSTGKADVALDAIISKEAAKLVEVAGFAGYEWRGSADGFDLPTGALRWGGGLTFPSRNIVRLNAELNGYVPSSDTATITGTTLRATDGSFAPLVSATENITRAPGAGRPARQRGEGLSGQPRRDRGSAADGELRRGAAEVRQRARGDAAAEPAGRTGGELAAVRRAIWNWEFGIWNSSPRFQTPVPNSRSVASGRGHAFLIPNSEFQIPLFRHLLARSTH